jgi:hypothetical protein
MVSLLRSATFAIVAIALIATGMYMWQASLVSASGNFASLAQMRAAFARVVPGMPAAELAQLGFDRSRPSAATLSYLAAMEFFMPKNSLAFDRLDPAILSCFSAADRCIAYVFFAGRWESGGLLDLAADAAPQSRARIVFLVKSGRVAYKAMTPAR